MRSTLDVYVRMRDGVGIPVDIYFPEGPGPFPTVLIRTPYVKSAPDLQPPSPPPPWLGLTPEGRSSSAILRLTRALPALNVLPLVEAGYAVVMGDSRGTGYAEGIYDYYNVNGGPFDGYDTIEWLAEQEWCDGNVGIFGVSGSGVLALAAAVTAPPHLKAVVAMAHAVDFYHDQWFPGGVYRFEDRVRWVLAMQGPLGPLDPGAPSAPAYEAKRRVFAARYTRFFNRMRAGHSMIDLGWATTSTQHHDFDDYWRDYDFSDRLANITAPTLTAGVIFDHFISGATRLFGGLRVPRRMVLVPGMLDVDGAVGDADLPALQLRWFDRYLKGLSNDVDQEAAVRLHLTGSGSVVESNSWPPEEAEAWVLHLVANPDGEHALAAQPQSAGLLDLMHDPESPNHSPLDTADQRPFDAGALVFTTSPLVERVIVAGEPLLSLSVDPLTADIDLAVRLSDVQPDGSSRLLGTGQLRVRADDAARVIELPMLPVAFDIAAGHRIRLAIAASDYPFLAIRSNPSQLWLRFGSGVETISLPTIRTADRFA
ncbi:CocE/NonD family hydrolase [Jatrophihabitans sp. DSM 45814]